jgi:protein SCO1
MTKCKTCLFIISLFVTSLLFAGKDVKAEDLKEYSRTVANYAVPDVTLVNQDGKRVKLRSLLNSKKFVMVDFVFTTCTTICPILSAEFADFQNSVGPDLNNVLLVSVSIDPENDTPKKMKEYLKRYGAKPGWDFLTGSHADIDKVIRAFDAYVADKMYHMPLAFLHSSADSRWVRIYGLVGTSEMMDEYKRLVK